MKASVERIDLQPMRVLIMEPTDNANDVPVLLYLHGRGEASLYENQLPRVCYHLSPPFQAILGNLTNVVVVAPQAPHDPNNIWNWQTYVKDLCEFLTKHFSKRQILATGFSRGGLGVLQLNHAYPELISKWAIIDPQRAADDAEEKKLLPQSPPDERGWLRYGNQLHHNTPFSETLSKHLVPQNAKFVDRPHGELALAAYKGDNLKGSQSLYEFLGLKYKSVARSPSLRHGEPESVAD
jgi:pimeloyl-ACP methyl ester carboxylesterase